VQNETTPPTATRRFPRLRADAVVLFSCQRSLGRARLRDISLGGLGVVEALPHLRLGDRVPVTVAIGFDRVGPLEANVVWSDGDRAGLELTVQDPHNAERIQIALDRLTSS